MVTPQRSRTRARAASEAGLAALAVVVNHGTNEALETVAALRAENARLKAENDFYKGVPEHKFGPEEGRFVIARYDVEQRFEIYDVAKDWYIKWGSLHWQNADNKWYQSGPFYGPYLDQEGPDCKRPDAIRFTNEDEQGLYADYEADMAE